jgi:hypothetical protein
VKIAFSRIHPNKCKQSSTIYSYFIGLRPIALSEIDKTYVINHEIAPLKNGVQRL